ncbi:peroxide/acid stress response protein YhcN [Hafnia paralvei]|uniref:peroxide/acid stress response protein YhcN n=1 Tax=Hafnia paralvei TaxID=546367 RepID=UPI00203316B6|nr:peroxide/acid stress response protein YhcN [Hafnia paralvei]
MKIKTSIAALAILSSLSFGAFAAQLVDNAQASNMQPIGTISVSGVSGVSAAPSDIRAALSAKADAQGATAYRVVEARNEGSFHATAEIYK